MPLGSSGRRARCAACPRARLDRSSPSSAAARVQRSTPPAASSRASCAARWVHVIQNWVGNGVPSEAYGSCSTTAGRPKGQRAATRRNARGGRPSWRSTIARSSISAVSLFLLVTPGSNTANDEELLAGLHEPEASSLLHERLSGIDAREARFELLLFLLELRHLVLAPAERSVDVFVVANGLPIEEHRDRHSAHGEEMRGTHHGATLRLARSESYAISTLITFVVP